MTDVQDRDRLSEDVEQESEKTAQIQIPSQFRPAQAPAGQQDRNLQQALPQPMALPNGRPQGPANGFALAALCVAAVGLIFTFPLITGALALTAGVLAIVLGVIGLVRAHRGATKRWMAIVGLALGALVALGGSYNSVVVAQLASPFIYGIDAQVAAPSTEYGTPESAQVPYVGAPAAPAPAPPVSYTYEVSGNYSAGSLSYTNSNGDSTIDVEGTKLPWTKTVKPEPNGNGQYLSASTMSTKGDSWITCTLKDGKGKVVETDTKRGAYASCMLRTWD